MVSIEASKEVYELLVEVARRKGRSVEEVVVEPIVRDLDPKARIEAYIKLHEKNLREAEELHSKGDLPQAGEKYWSALTALLNAVGEKEELPHYTHRDLRGVVEHLTEETRDPDYSRLFSSAEALHANFYHNFMSKLSFEAHRSDAIKLIQKIEKPLKPL